MFIQLEDKTFIELNDSHINKIPMKKLQSLLDKKQMEEFEGKFVITGDFLQIMGDFDNKVLYAINLECIKRFEIVKNETYDFYDVVCYVDSFFNDEKNKNIIMVSLYEYWNADEVVKKFVDKHTRWHND